MEQGYWLNVAKATGAVFIDVPQYTHHCRVFCGDHWQDSPKVARDVAARFPAPEFKCELTLWKSSGQSVDL